MTLKSAKARIQIGIMLILLYNILYNIPFEKNLIKFDNYIDSFNYYIIYNEIDAIIEEENCVMIIYTESNGNKTFATIEKNNEYWNSVDKQIKTTGLYTFDTVIMKEYELQDKIFIGISRKYFDNSEYKELYISDSLNSEFKRIEFDIYTGKQVIYYTFMNSNRKIENYNIKINGEKININIEEKAQLGMNAISTISLGAITVLILIYLLNLINRKKYVNK